MIGLGEGARHGFPIHLAFLLPQQLGYVFGEDVNLDIHPLARSDQAKRGDSQCVGNQHDGEAVLGDVNEGEAHAVHRNGPLWDQILRPP